MKKVLLLVLIATAGIVRAQAQTADRQTISSGGDFVKLADGTSFSSTIGETVISTIQGPGIILTQGFQQPETFKVRTVEGDIEVTIYPNPAVDQVTAKFKLKNDYFAKVFLINNAGQVMGEAKPVFEAGDVSYNFNFRVAAGVYYLSFVF